jgi:hypothetical protein
MPTLIELKTALRGISEALGHRVEKKESGFVLSQRAGLSKDEIERIYRPDLFHPVKDVRDAVRRVLSEYKSAKRTPDFEETLHPEFVSTPEQREAFAKGWTDGYEKTVREMESLIKRLEAYKGPGSDDEAMDWRVFQTVATAIERIYGSSGRKAGDTVFGLVMDNSPKAPYYLGYEGASQLAVFPRLIPAVIEKIFKTEMEF